MSTREKSCDILVIGGGGSGMVAAVRAAQMSGGKVIVLEKGKVTGGGMLFASTMRTFQSKWQKERGIPDQSNAFIRSMMDLTLWRLDPETVKRAVLGTGAFFDWYSELEEPEVLAAYEPRPYVFDIPVHGQVGPQIDGFHNGSGRVIMNTMARNCERFGVEVLTQHRAVRAEQAEGRISAVTAECPEGEVRISCKVCILACGSWIRNESVVERVCPAFLRAEVLPNAHQNPNYTGDGIPIAEQAGALVDWDSFCLRLMGPICSYGETSRFDALSHAEESILINLEGERFVAEPMAPRMDPFDTGHVLLQIPRGKSFFLFSANSLDAVIRGSQANGESPDTDPFGMPALPALEEITGWFREEMEKGSHEAGCADTLEELGEWIGVDSRQLKQTVEAYNRACAEGLDWEFFKDPAHMVPLSEGPFYALGGKLSTDGAFGGVKVDATMQAYAADGGRVPGLYVTGDFASGRHIVMSGVKKQVLNDMSWALSSGFLAGTAAAESLREEA